MQCSHWPKTKSLRQIVLCSHLFFVLLYEKKNNDKKTVENWLCPVTPLVKIQNIKYNHYALNQSCYAFNRKKKKKIFLLFTSAGTLDYSTLLLSG